MDVDNAQITGTAHVVFDEEVCSSVGNLPISGTTRVCMRDATMPANASTATLTFGADGPAGRLHPTRRGGHRGFLSNVTVAHTSSSGPAEHGRVVVCVQTIRSTEYEVARGQEVAWEDDDRAGTGRRAWKCPRGNPKE